MNALTFATELAAVEAAFAEPVRAAPVFTVKRQSPSGGWGVYRNGELIEGGFFDRYAADECCATWAGFIPAVRS